MDDATTHDALPLRTVSRLTGLSPDIIRAWEKRYAVVAPKRGPRGARLYTAQDVALLRLLRQVVAAGRAIGDVAKLGRAALEALASGHGSQLEGGRVQEPLAVDAQIVDQAVAALEDFDLTVLDRCLGDALIALGGHDFVARVVTPLLVEVGQRWSDGRLSVGDEHLLSSQLRNLLAGLLRSRQAAASPTILLATPSGERHEFGLLIAGLLIADAGVGLCYLGTDLPAAEIAAAARRARSAVVGLSLVNGGSIDTTVAEVRRIERGLPATVELWLGGQQAQRVAARMGSTRAIVLDRIPAIEAELARLRALSPTRP